MKRDLSFEEQWFSIGRELQDFQYTGLSSGIQMWYRMRRHLVQSPQIIPLLSEVQTRLRWNQSSTARLDWIQDLHECQHGVKHLYWVTLLHYYSPKICRVIIMCTPKVQRKRNRRRRIYCHLPIYYSPLRFLRWDHYQGLESMYLSPLVFGTVRELEVFHLSLHKWHSTYDRRFRASGYSNHTTILESTKWRPQSDRNRTSSFICWCLTKRLASGFANSSAISRYSV